MTIESLTQCRQRLTVRGTVQGVGFRPFVYRLATVLGLGGGVKNTAEGVVIDIEGTEHALDVFRQRLQQDLPPHAAIQTLKQQSLPLQRLHDFQIWESEQTEDGTTTQILPDLATCPDCLKDIFDPDDRRFHYAFTNCTHCGPRFSIITALPYDRPHTTMATFSMCPDCQTEYMEPTNRRFHAQPNACSHCGPQLEFWIEGQVQSSHSMDDLIQGAIAALRRGEIVALKGLGGFQLLVDAQNPLAVARLRQQKGRPDKPLALMCSTVEVVSRYCEVSEESASLLTSAQAPIVLLPKVKPQKSDGLALADGIAPGNPYLGVMLPTTPLHHLLLHHYGAPLVATSGNASGAPICIDNQDARERLTSAADTFLVHNRPIQRPMDDSVVQLIQGKPQVLRHSRGYAPQAIQLQESLISNARILAVGAHLKNAIALSLGDQVVLSQYIGDLDTYSTIQRLQQTITDFLTLYRCQPTAIACDRHPDYQSTQLANTLAQQWDVPLIPVQHHYAHVLSAMADHQLAAPVLGIAWDGTGYGLDQTIWGGEFLHITDDSVERVAHFLPFPLPGGDICSREPRRSALGLLYSCFGDAAFDMTDLAPMQTYSPSQRDVLHQMLANRVNTPMTSSVGRLFDGIAALLDLHQQISFEGQAAMALEFAASTDAFMTDYPFMVSTTMPYVIDWRPMVKTIIDDYRQGVSFATMSARFHRTLVAIVEAIVHRVGLSHIVLTGGCFQNRLLTERSIRHLRRDGFSPYWHQRIPSNDGGIAVGQAIAALRHLSQA